MSWILGMWAGLCVLVAGNLAYLKNVRDRAEAAVTSDPDRLLAQWCRHTHLSVITHTGMDYTVSLSELQTSQVSDFRQWNIPVTVTLWSDTDPDNALMAKDNFRG